MGVDVAPNERRKCERGYGHEERCPFTDKPKRRSGNVFPWIENVVLPSQIQKREGDAKNVFSKTRSKRVFTSTPYLVAVAFQYVPIALAARAYLVVPRALSQLTTQNTA